MIDKKKEQFDDITKHLLEDIKPSQYITMISNEKEYSCFPYSMLWKLKDTEQSKTHHPEGSVWNHTMLVLDEAAKVRDHSNDSMCFMWAALLHDIGKANTTRVRNGKITSYDHDKEGEKLARRFLKALTEDEEFIIRTSSLVRYHMHMLYVLKALPYSDVKNMLKCVDIHEIALLCKCDRLGRTGAVLQIEEENYKEFLSRLERKRSKDL